MGKKKQNKTISYGVSDNGLLQAVEVIESFSIDCQKPKHREKQKEK